MDLLAKRYASPFSVLDGMIKAGRLYDFVVEVNNIINEETYESKLWDIWLHKIFHSEWEEWREYIRSLNETPAVNEINLEATVTASHELLNNFNPNEE